VGRLQALDRVALKPSVSVSLRCDPLRLQLVAGTGCLLALAAMIVASPPQLRYDERNHISLAQLVAKNGWRGALTSPANPSAAGPLYPGIHLALSPITDLQAPAIRWVNFCCFVGIVLLFASYKSTESLEMRITFGLSLLAVPFLWPAVGMALTELPALLFFTCFILLFLRVSHFNFALNAKVFGLASAAGGCLGVAILGRQTYLVVVPVVFVMMLWLREKWPAALLCSITALAISGWLFALWHGLAPPQYYRLAESSVSFSHLLLSLSYASVATLFLNPLWFFRKREKAWIVCAFCGVALAYVARKYEEPPAKSLLVHLFGMQMGLSVGFVVGCALAALGVIWLWTALRTFWRKRCDPAEAFLWLSLGALVLAPIKMTAQFSSRYVVGSLGVLLLVVDAPRQSWRNWVTRMILGSLFGIAILWNYYQSG
jgi:hypothetical protein